jgi:predicted TIM-barrel fold metal-dependent hydrolase
MYFIDCETHIWDPMDDISYYPNFKKYQDSARYLMRMFGMQPQKRLATAEELIKSMDEGNVARACVLPEIMLGLSYGHRVRSTNGYVAKEVAKYPERLIGVANVGPVSTRGKDAVWELKYLVKEKGFKACKVYSPDDCPINDPRNWPLYEAIQELGIVLFIHTGLAYVRPGRSAYCHPMLLEDVCADFPEIPIVAYHMGYPYHRELIILAGMFNNIYLSTSLVPQLARVDLSPTLFAEIIGETVRYAGADKLIWGTDWSGRYVSHQESAELVKNFQIPEELQQRYGYPQLTEADKKAWAGGNLARILKIKIV